MAGKRHGRVANLIEAETHGFDLCRHEHASCETEVCELDVAGGVYEEIFGLQIPVDVAELMEGVDAGEHFGNVEAGVSVVKDTSVVEEGSKVAARDVFLGLPLKLADVDRDV